MYLANNTWLDITFSMNLLERYSSPTRRHWNGIKHIFHYLRGNIDMDLFYSNDANYEFVGYADARFLSNPHRGWYQTCYLFTCGNSVISWRSTKQTLVATSSNHVKILAIHEDSRECVWLRPVTQYIHVTCGLNSNHTVWRQYYMHSSIKERIHQRRSDKAHLTKILLHKWLWKVWWHWCSTNSLKR
jgi:hypothetical protein